MLIESHYDRHEGPPQAPRSETPARTRAALELRRSLHACPDRAPAAHAIYLQDLTSRFTAGPLFKRFTPGEFKFEGVDALKESVARMGEKLVKRLGMPISANADPALQKRLVAAGLFEEMDALRFGSHPYLPKVEFLPDGRAVAELYMNSPAVVRGQPAVEERLRAMGLPDFRSLMEAKMDEIEEENPGRLRFDVEAGKPKVPSPEQFRELLEHAVRIAQINTEVNQRAQPI